MINFTTEFKTLTGAVIKQSFKQDKMIKDKVKKILVHRAITLRDISLTSLMKNKRDEDETEIEENLNRYLLARKIENNDELELTEEEKILLKKHICRSMEILHAGQALEMIG